MNDGIFSSNKSLHVSNWLILPPQDAGQSESDKKRWGAQNISVIQSRFLKVKTTPGKKKESQKMNNDREESMHIAQRMADYRQFWKFELNVVKFARPQIWGVVKERISYGQADRKG